MKRVLRAFFCLSAVLLLSGLFAVGVWAEDRVSVPEIGDFSSLTEAVAATPGIYREPQLTPVPVRLTADLTEEILIPFGKNIYLDLCGHTLTAPEDVDILISNEGRLVLYDSVGGGACVNPQGIVLESFLLEGKNGYTSETEIRNGSYIGATEFGIFTIVGKMTISGDIAMTNRGTGTDICLYNTKSLVYYNCPLTVQNRIRVSNRSLNAGEMAAKKLEYLPFVIAKDECIDQDLTRVFETVMPKGWVDASVPGEIGVRRFGIQVQPTPSLPVVLMSPQYAQAEAVYTWFSLKDTLEPLNENDALFFFSGSVNGDLWVPDTVFEDGKNVSRLSFLLNVTDVPYYALFELNRREASVYAILPDGSELPCLVEDFDGLSSISISFSENVPEYLRLEIRYRHHTVLAGETGMFLRTAEEGIYRCCVTYPSPVYILDPFYSETVTLSYVTVTLVPGNGSPNTVLRVLAGTCPDLPQLSAQGGRPFDGWYSSESGRTVRFDSSAAVTRDITLYAAWRAPASPQSGDGIWLPLAVSCAVLPVILCVLFRKKREDVL